MEKKTHSSNGFVFGLILGIVITLLFTTKRGRKILSELSEGALDLAENKFGLKGIGDAMSDDEFGEDVEDQSDKKRIFKGVKKTSSK